MSVIWYRDIGDAFGRDNAHKFVPLRTMNLTQQLNATFRLATYYSAAMVLLTRNPGHLTAAVLTAVLTAAIHELAAKELFLSRTAEECVQPTRRNPYMNVSLADRETNPGRGAACDPLAPAVKRRVELMDSAPLTDGPYDSAGSRWYTMPVTTVPNDQEGYARALYGGRQNSAPGS
jgi:hypothetical protein